MCVMPDIRSYVTRHFALELNDHPAGFLRSVEGGGVKAEVVAQQVGGMPQKAKHIALPQPEAISISVGMSMSKSFWTWIKESWDGNIKRKDGAIQSADHNLKVMHEQSFQQALITETVIPALDGSSKEPGYLTVKFMPEMTRHSFKQGERLAADYFKNEQKLWSLSNFRLEMDGLDCSKVNKIESFTIKQGVKRLEVGGQREYELEPTSLDFPNLTITLAESHAKTWYDWFKDFNINGLNTADKEKAGRIVFTSPNRQHELLEIILKNVGISSFTPDKGDANSDSIRRVKIELYVEEMDLKYKG
jgi:hypothetical protein